MKLFHNNASSLHSIYTIKNNPNKSNNEVRKIARKADNYKEKIT